MRLFVALEIPAEVREKLASLIKVLHKAAEQSLGTAPRWELPENLHVTLKFIGEVAAARLAPICSALASMPSGEPITLKFRGLGFFPNEKNPKVLWAGIEGSPNLATLAANLERALQHLGIPREQRAFKAHLTLARFDPPGSTGRLRAAIEQNATRVFGSLHARAFHLIESELKPSGAEYTTVQSFPFAEAEA